MGTLKAKVGGVWTPVTGNPQSAADLARWNSAWGIIAIGALGGIVNISSAGYTDFTPTLSVTLIAGRRYRLYCIARAADAGVTGVANRDVVFRIMDGATVVGGGEQQRYMSYGTQYDGVATEWVFTGDGKAHTYKVQATTATSSISLFADAPNQFYIEDVGPVVLAAISPPAASPRVVASGNALGIIGMGAFIPPLAPRTIAVNTETALTYPLPFFAAVGRRYRVRFQARAITYTTGAGNTSFFLRDNGTVTRSASGGDPYTFVSGAYTGASYDWLFEGDGLQHSVELLCNGIAMSIYVDYGLWYVEDIGPNSVPALPIPETPPAWTALTLASGWTFAGIWDKPGFRKVGDLVHVRGFAMMTTASPPSTIATLPVGFRPPSGNIYGTIGGDTPTSPVFTRIQITSNGNIGWASGPTPAVNNWVSLSLPPFSTTA